MVDDKVSDSLRAAEEALVQGYAEGGLPPDVRKRFESVVAPSVAWQRKVRFAKALLAVAPKVKKTSLDAPVPTVAHDADTEGAAPIGAVAEVAEFETLFRTSPNQSLRRVFEDKPLRQQLLTMAGRLLSSEGHLAPDRDVLLNEALGRLASAGQTIDVNEGNFAIAAARVMRRVLVDRARARKASLPTAYEGSELDENILAIDAAFREIELINPRASRAVDLIYFGGLSVEAAAEVLGVSPRTVRRDLVISKSFISQTKGDGRK